MGRPVLNETRSFPYNHGMLAVAVTTPGEVRVVEVPEPAPGPYQAKVRTELSCLCNSTDTKLIKGHFPGIEDYPLLLGHETVGLVQSVGANVRSFNRATGSSAGYCWNRPLIRERLRWLLGVRAGRRPRGDDGRWGGGLGRPAGPTCTRSSAWCRRRFPWKQH